MFKFLLLLVALCCVLDGLDGRPKFLGCFNQRKSDDFKGTYISPNNKELITRNLSDLKELCFNYCVKQYSLQIVGIRGAECLCSTEKAYDDKKFERIDPSYCNISCYNNNHHNLDYESHKETCGGNFGLSVYHINNASYVKEKNINFSYVPPFKDNLTCIESLHVNTCSNSVNKSEAYMSYFPFFSPVVCVAYCNTFENSNVQAKGVKSFTTALVGWSLNGGGQGDAAPGKIAKVQS